MSLVVTKHNITKWAIGVALVLLLLPLKTALADVPVWVTQMSACTLFQKTNEQFTIDLQTRLAKATYDAQRQAQMRDIIKAREDVNKLVATVYNELRTQQIALNYGELENILPSLGIAVTDNNTDEICKAAYEVKASVGGQKQCVAVAQEARIITNQDDYIYEESRRRAMDALFCYLGDWRHFPLASVNDPENCSQLGLGNSCTDEQIWDTLGKRVKTTFSDPDGTASPRIWDDDQSVFNLCEGMRSLGLKCAQDMLRDYIKYSTVDKITRKDRTVILAPPQTWYTPSRCKVIDAFLPTNNTYFPNPSQQTPYTKIIKSLDSMLNSANVKNSFDLTNVLFGSKFGNPTINKPPQDMPPAEYTISKEMQGINVPENNFSGLASKTEQLANKIISEVTDLRKLQYTSGQGLRDATLRIGWQDFDWDAINSAAGNYLGKYEALDLITQGHAADPNHPNKIYKPLPCYWGGENAGDSTLNGCWSIPTGPAGNAATPTGKYFYFDTGLVIAPISITKDKLQSAIQAQFDLAQKALDDRTNAKPIDLNPGSCQAHAMIDLSIHDFLPAPWEDDKVNLANAINPLTGQPYTFGSPGPQNPPFRIPGISNNYFNFFYNDVFQLYHTPLPDVLAGWFRLNEPAYDSIYGLLKTPISFDANGGPGAGPPGGGGGSGGSGIGGTGGGSCSPVSNPASPCSVDNLRNTCFANNAQQASTICNVESGGNPFIGSGVDHCQDGNPFSWGLFQINLTVNPVGGLDCPKAFSGKNSSCRVVDQSLYQQCVTAAQDPTKNIQEACALSSNGTNWGPWRNTVNKCSTTPGATSPSPSGGGGGGSGGGDILSLINNYRSQNGLSPLAENSALDQIAQHHSDWMAANGLSHNDDFGDPFQRARRMGYTCSGFGENVAGPFPSTQEVFTAWQNSPEHNVNMLRPEWRSIGIANTNGWWTNDFSSC